jgi:hypothetical protein
LKASEAVAARAMMKSNIFRYRHMSRAFAGKLAIKMKAFAAPFPINYDFRV